jgi:hypothetical protein
MFPTVTCPPPECRRTRSTRHRATRPGDRAERSTHFTSTSSSGGPFIAGPPAHSLNTYESQSLIPFHDV